MIPKIICISLMLIVLSSCERQELKEQSQKNSQVIGQLEAQLKLLVTDNETDEIPDPSEDLAEVTQMLEETQALIQSTEEEIAAQLAEKEKAEKETEAYRSQYQLRSE